MSGRRRHRHRLLDGDFLFLSVVVRWLWPTAVGVPVISLAIRHYEAAFGLD